MSPRIDLPAARIAAVLEWLRQHLSPAARLHSDSRAVRPGDAFFAYHVDGADNRPHLDDAIARGAAAVLWQDDLPLPKHSPVPVMAIEALDQLAGHIAASWYGSPTDTLLAIGVTGTNGKTSCSHWIAQALDALGTRCAIVGTLGSGLAGQLRPSGFTTPTAPELQAALADLRAQGAQAVAMEVSSHALHQGRVNGTAFEIAVFTNLSQDHLDYHGTLEAYEQAKAKLFQWPTLKAAVINRDDPAGQRLLAALPGRVRAITYGVTPAASGGESVAPQRRSHGDLSAAPVASADSLATPTPIKHLHAEAIRATVDGTTFSVIAEGVDGIEVARADVHSATLGEFNVANLLAVLGALLAHDVPFDQATALLGTLVPVIGRMERMGGRPGTAEPLVVIDYAHTPDALEKTLAALRPVAMARNGALICVFGCGGNRDAGKRPLMGRIAAHLADAVVLTSDNPRDESPVAIIDQIAAGIAAGVAAGIAAEAADGSESVDVRVPAIALRRIEDRASAILQTIRTAAPADVVLLAGKGHETTQEIQGRKRPFSEHDHVRLALAARASQARGDSE